MGRSHRFPYTARSSAVSIRHAVSIDERRAKFRQDLITARKEKPEDKHTAPSYFRHRNQTAVAPEGSNSEKTKQQFPGGKLSTFDDSHQRFRSISRGRSRHPTTATENSQDEKGSFRSCRSEHSTATKQTLDSDDEDEQIPQTVHELWFPGCHADIGGGWEPDPPENLSLSHGPLVWMVREAQKAGLVFNVEKMRELNCYFEDGEGEGDEMTPAKVQDGRQNIPTIEVNDDILPASPARRDRTIPVADGNYSYNRELPQNWGFVDRLYKSCTQGKIHDPLQRNQGTPTLGVLSWNIMEFLPFKRMDLRPDGSWKAISWPLPMGETRDIPDDVKIHHTVMHRMMYDSSYRPGNLIIGGGGRGKR